MYKGSGSIDEAANFSCGKAYNQGAADQAWSSAEDAAAVMFAEPMLRPAVIRSATCATFVMGPGGVSTSMQTVVHRDAYGCDKKSRARLARVRTPSGSTPSSTSKKGE